MSEDPSAGAQVVPDASARKTPLVRLNALLVVASSREVLTELSSHIDRNFGNCQIIHGISATELSGAILEEQGPPRPPGPANAPGLSDRQVAVLQYLAAGLINKQIADRMCVCEATIKAHLSQVYRVLGVSNRTQALAAARARGWLR